MRLFIEKSLVTLQKLAKDKQKKIFYINGRDLNLFSYLYRYQFYANSSFLTREFSHYKGLTYFDNKYDRPTDSTSEQLIKNTDNKQNNKRPFKKLNNPKNRTLLSFISVLIIVAGYNAYAAYELLTEIEGLINDERYEEVIKRCDEILVNKPIGAKRSDACYYYYKGLALVNLNKNEEAIIQFDLALEYYKYMPSTGFNISIVHYSKGRALHNLSKYQEAITAYDLAIEYNPKDSDIYRDKGRALFKINKYEEAISEYNLAIKYNPHEARNYINKGYAFFKLSKFEEAIYQADLALKFEPQNISAYSIKSDALNHLGKFEEAIIQCDLGLKLNSESSKLYYNKGIAQCNLGKYKEAIKYYDLALKYNPYHVHTHLKKSSALKKLGRHKEAVDQYNLALKLDSQAALTMLDKLDDTASVELDAQSYPRP